MYLELNELHALQVGQALRITELRAGRDAISYAYNERAYVAADTVVRVAQQLQCKLRVEIDVRKAAQDATPPTIECPNCGELEMPAPGGECPDCHHLAFF